MGLLNSIFGINSNSKKIKTLLEKDAIIIDVRSSVEFKQGNVPNSINIPINEFNILDLNNRMEVINQTGVYLDNNIKDKLKFNLYAVDKFFIEVEYNNQLNKIINIRSFKSGHLLDKYSNIDIYLK